LAGAKVEYKGSVAGDLDRVDRQAAGRIVTRIEKTLASEGRAGEPLAGEFAGLFKLRGGDYRVIYAKTVEGYLILRIGHRSEVYRRGRP
jgi:mRNA interferase RelE/StbE